MFKHDQEEIEIDNAKNELESYIFSVSTHIKRDFPEFFDPSKKDEYLQKTADAQCWFEENEFDRLPLQEYKNQLEILKSFGEPAILRRAARIEVPKQIREFIEKVENEKKKLDIKDAKYKHITDDERDDVRKDIDKLLVCLRGKLDEVEKTPKYLDLSFNQSDAQSKLNIVEKKVKDLFKKPNIAPLKKDKDNEKPASENISPER